MFGIGYGKRIAVIIGAVGIWTTAPALAQVAPEGFILHEGPPAVPQVSFQDAGGGQRDLSAFAGKVVLLNIWATWCAPCREELPSLDRLQGQLGGDKFQVVALSIDRNGIDAVRAFYAKVGIAHLAIYNDASGQAGSLLGAIGVPTTFLFDRDGKEIGRLIGPAKWDDAKISAFISERVRLATNVKALPKQ